MFWTCKFYKTQFCKQIMLSCVIKFEICEAIFFTHFKFVFGSMLYNDDGFLINIRYNDHLQFYTSIAHLFLVFFNYGWLDLSLIVFSNKCFHIIDRNQIMKKNHKSSLKQHFLMQIVQNIHYVDFVFGFHFFLALPTKAMILCLDSL
jgi:hypothetical protein